MNKTEGYRIVRVFGPTDPEPQFKLIDEVNFEGMAPREFYLPVPNTKEIAKHYGMIQPNWIEKIANLKNPNVLEPATAISTEPLPLLELKVNWVTPPDVMAYRAGKIKIAPMTSVGICITKDNQLIVGLRGGELVPDAIEKYATGFYGTIPAGMTTWTRTENPIKETIKHEFCEEIGFFEYEIGKMIGIVESTGRLPNRNFYVTLKTDATLEQIQKVNRRANEEYKTLKTKGTKKEEIEAELRRLELPIDCWESDPIRSIPNDSASIEQVLEALRGSFIGPALGALNIYAQTLKYIK